MDALIPLLTIFMLAVFVGFEIITKVPPLLHTPLMSGSKRHLGHHHHRRVAVDRLAEPHDGRFSGSSRW